MARVDDEENPRANGCQVERGNQPIARSEMQVKGRILYQRIKCILILPRVTLCVEDMVSSVIFRVWLAAWFFGMVLAILPSYIIPCKKSNPNLDQCIADSIESLRSRLAVGIPELGAPPLEPLELETVRLLRGPVGARLDVNLTSMQVRGPSTFKVHDLKSNLEENSFTFRVNFEKLNFRGKYQMDARLLLLRLSGKGDITGNFTGYSSDVILRGNKIIRDGVEHLNFERMELKINIGEAKVHLSNLFGGDPILGPVSNEILNSNSALFVEEVRPVLESSLADLFTEVANKVTRSFTYKELFPEE